MAGNAMQQDDQITGINITPLVDVMLVLLIIFMVTANLINAKSIAVDLPKAATGQETTGTRNLAFVVDKGGNLFVDGKATEIGELPAFVERARSENQQLQALIGADKGAPYGAVVKVIDTLRQIGVNDFALNIQAE